MTAKTFDCVDMKHEIQQRLRAERGPMAWAERNELLRGTLRADPHLARLLELSDRRTRHTPNDSS